MTRMARCLTALTGLVFLLSWTPAALAHSIGESYLFLKVKDGGLGGQVDIPLTKVGDILFADQIDDGIVTQQEFDANIQRLQAYIAQRVEIHCIGRDAPNAIQQIQFADWRGRPFCTGVF